MKKIGYIIRLHGVSNTYAYGEPGKGITCARVFPSRELARIDKRAFNNDEYTKPQEILQVELYKNGKAKKIIKKVY